MREALECVAAPAVRSALVEEALAAQGLATVPDDPERFAAFVSGPLRRAIQASLGEDQGRAAMAELERIAGAMLASRNPYCAAASSRETNAVSANDGRARTAARALTVSEPAQTGGQAPAADVAAVSKSARRARPPRRAAAIAMNHSGNDEAPVRLSDRSASAAQASRRLRATTPELARAAGARILVSTTRADFVRSLASHVTPDVDVIQCWNVKSLVQALQNGTPSTMVVVDCDAPGAKPPSVAALTEDFPALMNTVLVGADPVKLTELVRISPRVVHWRVFGAAEDLKEVAAHCAFQVV